MNLLGHIADRPSMPYVAGGYTVPGIMGVMMSPGERDLLVAAVREYADWQNAMYGYKEFPLSGTTLEPLLEEKNGV